MTSNGRESCLVVFSDLDGTLIDFETYSTETAKPLARALVDSGHLLVFCSSKTLAEQQAIMRRMDLDVPCIVENGSAIFLPPEFSSLRGNAAEPSRTQATLIKLGVDAERIQEVLSGIERRLKTDLGRYSTLGVDGVAAKTGLDHEAAGLARARDFSETLTADLTPETWSEVDGLLEQAGLRRLFGGRFQTVTSANVSKGAAVQRTMQILRHIRADGLHSIGIGDSANDEDMLRAVDEAYLVQRPDRTWASLKTPGINRVRAVGPEGWVNIVSSRCPMASTARQP